MEAYQAELDSLVSSAASPGNEITVLRLQTALVEGKGFASAQAIEVPTLLRSLARAVREGYDAIAIGNGFDPGLWEARELFDLPVLGLFETLAFYGLRAAWRLGVLCSGNSGITRVEELAARYGINSRMARPLAVGIPVPKVVAAFSDRASAEAVLDGTNEALMELKRRGAEAVVVASGALGVFLDVHKSRLPLDLPVLPSVQILVRELECAAGLAKMGVPYVSRTGRFAKPPSAVEEMLSP
ncbi:MAG TPA: aspartate/glutamate racemase family protein [Candidatus Dormibacteraeota bacterium]